MSKGLGQMERAILDAIASYDDVGGEAAAHVTRDMVAAAVFYDTLDGPGQRPARSQASSMNRGFRSLKRKGLIQEFAWPNTLFLTEAGRRAVDAMTDLDRPG